MAFQKILSDIQSKKFLPIYFLEGEEPYFIDKLTDAIEHGVLDEPERDFNQTVLYGKDTSVDEIVSTAKRYPMIAQYQVIIVKEAQHLSREIENLDSYAENPLATTILVINYKGKNLDKRKKLYKAIQSKGIVYNSDPLRDYQLPDWIIKEAQNHKLYIDLKSATLLSEHLGTDLNRIANEMEKLRVILPDGANITEQIIQDNIGISKEYNMFEFQDAIGARDVYKSNLIASHFGKAPKENPFVVIVSNLYGFFTKALKVHFSKVKTNEKALAAELGVHPFLTKKYKIAAHNYPPNKIARIIAYLREYDLKAKGVNNASAEDGELLKELLFKILH
ncbi:MAG: DNA polymerase III subunit delta [Flavobacteriales bacterium]